MTLIKVTDHLPQKGTECLVYSTQGGFSICRFTDINSTYGYHYKEAWFTKSGRQMSKKTITHWAELPERPEYE
jgi:carotenoid cleavage dioxygenase-like enzyme